MMKHAIAAIIVVVLAANAGAEEWFESVTPAWTAQVAEPTVAAMGDDFIVVGSRSGAIAVYDLEGALRWRYTTGTSIAAIALTRDVVAATTIDGVLLVFDDQGTLGWERHLGAPVEFPGALDATDEVIVAGTMQGSIHAFHINGSFIYTKNVGRYVRALKQFPEHLIAATDMTAVYLTEEGMTTANHSFPRPIRAARLSDPSILIALAGGSLVSVTERGGPTPLIEADDEIGAMACIENGYVFGTKSGIIHFVKENETARYSLSGPVTHLQGIEKYILAADANGSITLFNDQGIALWQQTFDAPALSVEYQRPLISVLTNDGGLTIYMLSLRNTQRAYAQAILVAAAILFTVALLVYAWRV